MAGIEQFRELPISERIQLVEDLWDTIAADSESIRLTDNQIAELDCRLDRFEENSSQGTEWSTLKARILNSL